MCALITNFFLLLAGLAATASACQPDQAGLGSVACKQQEGEQPLTDEVPATVTLLQGSKTLYLHDSSNLLQTLVEPTTPGVEEEDSHNSNGSTSLVWIHMPRCSSALSIGLLERQNANSNTNSSDSRRGSEGTGASSPAPSPALGDAHPRPLDVAAWRRHRGRLAAMFRRPTERMHSSWAWYAAGNSTNGSKIIQPSTYARQVTGLATKILAGQWIGDRCSTKEHECAPPQRETPKLALALARLDGFKFVGLTEVHSLSVCLFHAMFGGDCQPSDFEPTQRGSYAHSTPEIARFFQSFIDPYDEAVHQKASSIFWNNVRRHNVSLQTCRSSICPHAAEFFSS